MRFLTRSKKNEAAELDGTVKRWSVNRKATVKIGDFSRGGQTRGDDQASDHDFGCEEKYTPCGIVDEDSAQLDLTFGSSYKTSDFIVEALESKWNGLEEPEKAEVSKLQIKMDNGPESNGKQTQFLSRMANAHAAAGVCRSGNTFVPISPRYLAMLTSMPGASFGSPTYSDDHTRIAVWW
jgi:Rhodopirellula transposase DDE domain